VRTLLCAAGAEDATRPAWAHLVRSLADAGHDVVALDPTAAAACSSDPTLEHTLAWVLEATPPDLFIHVPAGAPLDGAVLDRVLATPGLRTVALLLATDADSGAGAAGAEADAAALARYDVVTAPDRATALALGVAEHPGLLLLPLACHTGLLRERRVSATFDVLVAGDATDRRVAGARRLRDAGVDVRVAGEGWEAVADLRPVAQGLMPYPERAALLSAARLVVAIGGGADSALAVLEAAACARPALVSLDAVVDGFERDRDVAVLDDEAAVAVAAARLLADLPTRALLASAAAERVRSEYTWRARWRALLEHLGLPLASARPTLAVTERAPRVTVTLPTYNVAEYLEDSVASVLAQTYRDFELVVLDDGSTDGTRAVLDRFRGDRRVRVHEQANLGQTGRFDLLHRRLAELARGDLLVYFGSDDLCHPQRLEQQVARFDADPQLDILHSGAAIIDSAGRVTGSFTLGESYTRWTLPRVLLRTNVVAHPTVMLRRACFERFGPYEEGFAADYHYWTKAARFAKFGYDPTQLLSYRVHAKGSSTAGSGLQTAALEGRRLRRQLRARMSITELYPELTRCGSPTAYAAAYLDLGNRLLSPVTDADAALAEYDRAAQHGADPGLLAVNRAVALICVGQHAEAEVVLAAHAQASAAARSARARLARALQGDVSQIPDDILIEGATVCPDLFRVAPTSADDVWAWDGSAVTGRRLVLAVDWREPDAAAVVLQAYCRLFTAGDPIELVLPAPGMTAEVAAERVAALVPGGFADLSRAADVIVEPDRPAEARFFHANAFVGPLGPVGPGAAEDVSATLEWLLAQRTWMDSHRGLVTVR
jgi:hypothetical protein